MRFLLIILCLIINLTIFSDPDGRGGRRHHQWEKRKRDEKPEYSSGKKGDWGKGKKGSKGHQAQKRKKDEKPEYSSGNEGGWGKGKKGGWHRRHEWGRSRNRGDR